MISPTAIAEVVRLLNALDTLSPAICSAAVEEAHEALRQHRRQQEQGDTLRRKFAVEALADAAANLLGADRSTCRAVAQNVLAGSRDVVVLTSLRRSLAVAQGQMPATSDSPPIVIRREQPAPTRPGERRRVG
jgi:hypothetical protein